jgi:superfamily II DNA/RNA helicase
MLTLLEKGRARARMPRTLILEPTRELAAQVAENFEKYGKNHKLNVALLIGGVSFDEQNRKLERGADVLICTPGRLLDHCERGKLLMRASRFSSSTRPTACSTWASFRISNASSG